MCFLESGLGLYMSKYVLKCQINVTKKINGVPCLVLDTSELFFLGNTDSENQVRCCDNFPEAK